MNDGHMDSEKFQQQWYDPLPIEVQEQTHLWCMKNKPASVMAMFFFYASTFRTNSRFAEQPDDSFSAHPFDALPSMCTSQLVAIAWH